MGIHRDLDTSVLTEPQEYTVAITVAITRLAQLVEWWTVMQQVPGSIPAPNSTWLGVDSALHPTVGR